MRKIIGALTILALAVPAMAGVCVECNQVPDTNIVEVTYTMDVGDTNLPRAFALDVTISVDNANDIDPNILSDEYYVAPGSYSYNEATGAVNWGNPVISADVNSFTIEMGSLWATNDPCHPTQPDPCGVLFNFTVDNDCTVTLEENAARAGEDSNGVVMEDTQQSFPANYVDLNGCTVQLDCFQEGATDNCGHTITLTEYNRWVGLGKPCCWCYDCHCKGDTDGNCTVNPDDVTEAAEGWLVYANGYCADTDYNGTVNPDDITAFADGWINGCPGVCTAVPPEPNGCDPDANS